jgi:hypothetical protein
MYINSSTNSADFSVAANVTGTLRFFDFFLKDEVHFTPPMFDPSQFFGSFYPQHSLNSETFWQR